MRKLFLWDQILASPRGSEEAAFSIRVYTYSIVFVYVPKRPALGNEQGCYRGSFLRTCSV